MSKLSMSWKFGYSLGLLRGISWRSDVPEEVKEQIKAVLPVLEKEDDDDTKGQ